MSDMNNEIKGIFEYEIKRKISEKARYPADEFRILMNGFKFYDYNNTGKVNKTEFVKGILRSGLSGFNESDLLSLFSCYDLSNSGFVDYKNFCNYLYGREPLKGTSNSQNQTQTTTDESINNNQRQKTPIVSQNNNMNTNNNNQNNQNLSGPQNINQAPTEQLQNQQNIDPNQTKEYFHKLIMSIKDQINTNNGLTFYTFLFEVKNNSDQNQTITIENFANVFKNIGLNISQNDISNLFNLLDFSQSGKVIIDDIINTIADPMNEHRKLYVVNKFSKMDLEKQGEVRISLLKEKYNPKCHPDVISGKTSDEEIYKQFCYTLDIYCSIRMITDIINYKQFIEYYNGISSAIFDENYFEAILNVWDDDVNSTNANNNTNAGKNINSTNSNNVENNSQQPQTNNNANMNIRVNEETKTIKNYSNNENQISSNERYTIDQNNNRMGRKKNNINNNYSTNDIGINSLFLGEPTHTLPKSFGRRNFKRYRPNFNPESPNNYYNNRNKNQYQNNNVEANNVQTNNINQNNNNRNNFNKTPISQNQAFQGNQNQRNNQNNYDEINNFNNIMNNEKQSEMKVNYNPITNVYTPNRDIHTQKTPLNQNINNNQNIQNNNAINENTSLNSTNNTVNNTQNKEDQIKEIITNSLNKLKSNFILGGSRILFSFQRKLSIYDINHNGLITLNNFLSSAQSYTMLSQDEIKIIFDLFDKDKAGSINYNELIQTIIEPVSPNRKLIIQKIYDNFNKDNNGKVSINEIKLSFNARRHPDVISGKKSEGEIFWEFLDNIESYREYLENMKGVYDNSISLEDFTNFYIEVGFGIEDDKMFEFMINNCWNLDNNIGLSGNRYRNNNNNRFGYRNNLNNNINNGNMMVRAGSQIINSKRF